MTARLAAAVQRLERHQVAVYLGAVVVAVVVGLPVPEGVAAPAEVAIEPVLATLLLATFLQVPFLEVRRGLADRRFLGTLLVLNFVVGPCVASVLVRFLPDERAVLVGVLLVLLTPCVDYVIVFTGLAGGAADRLVAAAPLLMVLQLALLPAYLYLFLGADVAQVVDPAPFLRALLVLIAAPLALAVVLQSLARRFRAARLVVRALTGLMVPLVALTLLVVVASQVGAVGERAGDVAATVPVHVAWFLLMVPLGLVAARVARLDRPRSVALSFSGATRNSLVVLPLALALPDELDLAPVVVVTQTLVELVAMVVLVRVLPAMTRTTTGPGAA